MDGLETIWEISKKQQEKEISKVVLCTFPQNNVINFWTWIKHSLNIQVAKSHSLKIHTNMTK